MLTHTKSTEKPQQVMQEAVSPTKQPAHRVWRDKRMKLSLMVSCNQLWTVMISCDQWSQDCFIISPQIKRAHRATIHQEVIWQVEYLLISPVDVFPWFSSSSNIANPTSYIEVQVQVFLHYTLDSDAHTLGKHWKTSTSEARRYSTCQTTSSLSVARFKRVISVEVHETMLWSVVISCWSVINDWSQLITTSFHGPQLILRA